MSEIRRVRELQSYGILDTAAEACFDDLLKIARLATNSEFGAISFIDLDRQWLKARTRESQVIPLDYSICVNVIRSKQELIIDDLSSDARFADNPFVTSGPRARRYAGFPLTTKNGHVIGTLCVGDPSSRKLEDQEIEILRGLAGQVMFLLEQRRKLILSDQYIWQSSRMAVLGESASSIAHEINNSLSIGLGLIQLLQEPNISGAKNKEMLDKLDDTLARIAKIVTGIRNLARDGKNDEFANVAVKQIVSDVTDIFRSRAKRHGVELRVDVGEGTIECRGTQIGQVLLNLMNNGLDAALESEDRWVSINTEDRGDDFIFRIMDSGAGVAVADRGKLMEPFFTTKAIGKGTGLGLSLSKRLVETHGGRIFLNADANNTEFCVVIPKRQRPVA